MTTDHEPWRETVLRCLHGERCGSFHSAIDICLAPIGLQLIEQAKRSYEAGAASRDSEVAELQQRLARLWAVLKYRYYATQEDRDAAAQ